MTETNQKLFYKISILAIIITTVVNVWMQCTTGQVNGSIFTPIAIICVAFVLLTIILFQFFTPRDQRIKNSTSTLVLLLLLAIIATQAATALWGFSPTPSIF